MPRWLVSAKNLITQVISAYKRLSGSTTAKAALLSGHEVLDGNRVSVSLRLLKNWLVVETTTIMPLLCPATKSGCQRSSNFAEMKIKSASNCQRSGAACRPMMYSLLRELKLRCGFHGGRAPYRPNRMCGDLPAGLMIFCPRI